MISGLRSVVSTALLDAWAVLQPVDCAGCGRADRGICGDCRGALVPAPRSRLVDGLDVPVRAAATYSGVLRRILLAGKDLGRADALRSLAPVLAHVVIETATAVAGTAGPVELAWVPSTGPALRRRGFDPVLVMLRAAGMPGSRVLIASRGVQQKALGREDRIALAAGRLRPTGSLHGRRFVLVDDVVTTGSTVRAAVAALRLGGGDVFAVCCLGTVDRLHPGRDSDVDDH